jgi:hypothetical protein
MANLVIDTPATPELLFLSLPNPSSQGSNTKKKGG